MHTCSDHACASLKKEKNPFAQKPGGCPHAPGAAYARRAAAAAAAAASPVGSRHSVSVLELGDGLNVICSASADSSKVILVWTLALWKATDLLTVTRSVRR